MAKRRTQYKTDDKDRVPWIQHWHKLIKDMQKSLPDVDIPVNLMDEPRLLVPWDKVNEYMKVSDANKHLNPVAEVVTAFTGLAAFDADESNTDGWEHYDPQWRSGPYWDLVWEACPPDSPAANASTPINLLEHTLLPEGYPEHPYQGYVSN
jgi:hypothetical protein